MHASVQSFGQFPLHSRSKLKPPSNPSAQRRQLSLAKHTKFPRCSCVAEAPAETPVKPASRAEEAGSLRQKPCCQGYVPFLECIHVTRHKEDTQHHHTVFTQAKPRRLCRNSIKGCGSGLKMATWPCLLPILKLSKAALIMPGRCMLLLQRMLSAP